MTYLITLLYSFLVGLCILFPSCLHAQKYMRSAWVRQLKNPVLPAHLLRNTRMRAWQYISRPTVQPVYFPQMDVPNSAVWNIPLNVNLQREVYTQAATAFSFPGKQKIDAVIFDLDGTLLDSLGAWEHSGSNFVRTQGFEPSPGLDDELVALSLLDGAKLIKTRYHLEDTPEEILEKTLLPIKNHYYHDIAPMPGMVQLLARLHTQGIKMAVATAGDKTLAQAALARLGLDKYFAFIITCDEVGVGKSSPRIYEEALHRLGTSKARTLVAEDALHALQTAHAAGFPTLAIDEAHSFHQRVQKEQVATYFVVPGNF